jgi:hypothetical protein
MARTKKPRIPSTPYIEKKIAEIGAVVNPTQEEILLLAHYKKMIEQIKNEDKK